MAVTLYHNGRTPGQQQFGLTTFTEHYKAAEAADVVMLDSGVPQQGDAHPDYPHMFVTDRYCSESGESASALDIVYMGCLLDDGGGGPVLPPQKPSSGGQVASATTNTSSAIFPATTTNPATVQFYAITNTLSFYSNDPADTSEPDDPAEITDLITWDLGFGLQPGLSMPDLVAFLLEEAFVQGIIEPQPEVEPVVSGQFYLITKRKTRTLFPYAPAAEMDIDSIFDNLEGFTKKEREWLKNKLKPALKTVQGVAGRNCSITNSQDGQVINGNDCPPCP